MTAASLHTIDRRGGTSGALRRLGLAALAGLAALVTQAALAQVGTRLEKVELQPQPGEQLEVRLLLDGPAPQPVAFTIDNPARLAVDLPGTTLALDSRRIDVKAGGVDTIVAAEASGRTRLVFNLDQMQPYQTRVSGNSVIVTIGQGAAGGAPAATAAVASGSSAIPAGPISIEKVDFRRGADGAGRILVRTTDARAQASLKQEGGRIVVDFPRATVTKDQARRYDVVDFATPVSSFDVAGTPSGARIVVAAVGDFEQLAYQSDHDYVLELRPRAKSASAEAAKKEYKGERLTLNFQDIETRAVLQLLAETSGQNIVVSDSVQGNVTLRLQNVPWDQALDIVLRTKGLDKRQEGNVIFVAPAEELAAREKAAARVAEVDGRAGAAAHRVPAGQLREGLRPGRPDQVAGQVLAAVRPRQRLDRRSHQHAAAAGHGRPTRRHPPPGVDARHPGQAGADRGAHRHRQRRLQPRARRPLRRRVRRQLRQQRRPDVRRLGGLDATDGDRGPIISPNGPGGAGLDGNQVSTPPADDRYIVNLPVANPAGRIALTLLDSDYVVDLELSAAQSEGRGEIVSSPRVITANGKEASIEQGVEIPYQESASSGATTTQFKKAVLSLKVTPQITPDDRIILDLDVSKDSVGQVVPSATGGFVPRIDTREIITQVLVNDGQTVVLGGILETERRDTVNKVPYLGDIPGLGVLFRSKQKTDNKDELLIFVTPKILREAADIY